MWEPRDKNTDILLTLIHYLRTIWAQSMAPCEEKPWCMYVDIPAPPPGVDQSQRGALVNQESATSRQIGHKGNIGPNK